MSIAEILNIMAKYAKTTGLDYHQMYVDGIVYTQGGKAVRFRVEVLEVCDASKVVIDRMREDDDGQEV